MLSSAEVPPNRPVASNHHNSPGNSGSQYALCALGVGLVALGIVMIVWSVVPSDMAGNNSSGTGGGNPKPDTRGRTSSVAFVLVGAGVAMLLLSLCLGMRNKQREQQVLLEAQTLGAGNVATSEDDGETAEERAQRYTVPSYEEVVGSGEYPIRQSNLRHSSSQLPSYDDLVDGVQMELEGSDVTQTSPASANPASSAVPNRRTGRTGLKLLPLKIRRIKSEKLFMNNTDNSQPPGGITIEPLTPPPMYEDKAPQL
ncbi:transmembrane protein 51a [Oncorhynchus keta]|uniref:transmembrane protein 51a n=1 Tax=Oncorhynchus keta TaxID=8018 RepID=UPI0015FE5E2B|nr:transmembrane protein 51a [Oncorhynchus keta]XP_035596761.1 transmembrane protein 51a [Oncorhynchus keta]XP_052338842.1 transmembrane protein 51a [Oncorhynchus keta]